jgi:hypothetical protein
MRSGYFLRSISPEASVLEDYWTIVTVTNLMNGPFIAVIAPNDAVANDDVVVDRQ